jgi:LPS-assembly protein
MWRRRCVVDNSFYKPPCHAQGLAAQPPQRGAPNALLPLPRSPRPASSLLHRLRFAPVALALTAWGAGSAWAQQTSEEGITLQMAPALQPPPRGEASRWLPIILRAQELRGRPDLETVAEGNAEFRRGGLVLRADRLTYEHAEDLALARGNVRVSKDGNVYSGPELQLRVQSFEGYFLNPTYYFGRTGAGGTAQRFDFLDDQRVVATGATYSSCPPDGSGGPAWLLTTDRVKLDFETNEGVAEKAVLRFYGVPILAAPVLSFPLTDERKSGWLPPSVNLDSKSGLQFSIPYYWNIAPNRDATLTPLASAKRGVGLDTEVRYLEPRYHGTADLTLLPNDGLTGRSRYALNLAHDSDLPNDTALQLRVLRVSDDEYWKDFPRGVPTLTPRLLASDFKLTRPVGDWTTYTRIQGWQVLQDADPASRIEAPYERLPQIGARYLHRVGPGFEVGFEGELNRFVDPPEGVSTARPTGLRVHALGSVSRPFVWPGWTVTPKLSFNAATYALDQPLTSGTLQGRSNASRIIPSLSIDSAWALERDANWFGASVRQTLEPRLLYVNTPFRAQDALPNFDSAAKDFNFESIFTENAFSGVDRVSDAHQITAGVTTRVLDPETGAESLRLGLVQRYLFRDQRITPDGVPFTRRFSDVLLLGSTTLVPLWTLDASVQYGPDSNRTVRSILGARYSPGPYRTAGLTYRLTRGLSEQIELGWQWPVYGRTPDQVDTLAPTRTGASCTGSWYSVGRINYSTRDSRITDSVLGLEYDAGCWIGRVVAERLSTGRSEATTRLLLQLELVGLSRLGSNPLQVLKDNIPGYRLLRDDRTTPTPMNFYD